MARDGNWLPRVYPRFGPSEGLRAAYIGRKLSFLARACHDGSCPLHLLWLGLASIACQRFCIASYGQWLWDADRGGDCPFPFVFGRTLESDPCVCKRLFAVFARDFDYDAHFKYSLLQSLWLDAQAIHCHICLVHGAFKSRFRVFK